MRVHNKFPAYTHKNADFVTGRSTLDKGERVLDLQVDVEDLGTHGTLCVREKTVRAMMSKLKIEAARDEDAARLLELEAENESLRAQLDDHRTLIAKMKELSAA